MNKLEELTQLVSRIASDRRVKPIHASLLVALCHVFIMNRFVQPFRISRKPLMKISCIQSQATYHKVMKDLQTFGYLKYNPSYHPKNASKASLQFTSNVC